MNHLAKQLLYVFLALFTAHTVAAQNQSTNRWQHFPVPGIENFFQLSTNCFSGGTPLGDEAYALLKERGVKTIISVDGAKPDAEAASRHGMQYVHLPMGYGTVSDTQRLRLLKAAETLPQPLFVHCHHGKHRGPTAAAIICMGEDGWTPGEGLQWLRTAGTATNYAGLYKTVAEFNEKTNKEALSSIPSSFSAHENVSTLVDAMVQIDERMDHLKIVQKAGFKPTSSHPDIQPAQEALLLHELFTELLRTGDLTGRSPDFRHRLEDSINLSGDLQKCLNGESPDARRADLLFQELGKACGNCHKAYRD